MHPFLPSACYAGYDDEEDDDNDDDDDVMILCKNETSRHHDNDKFGLKVMITYTTYLFKIIVIMIAVIAIITERIVVPDLQEYYEQMN